MTRNDITTLTRRHAAALHAEAQAARHAAEAKAGLGEIAAIAISEGYRTGKIAGKNADARARAEKLHLAEHVDYRALEAHQARLQEQADAARIRRQAIETEISLTRAWLYSLSGSR